MHERKVRADNLKSWSTPPSARSTRCRTSFDPEVHRPDETNPLRQDIVRRDRVPFRRIARPVRRKVARFSLAYGQVVNRVSAVVRVPSGETHACIVRRWHSAIANFCTGCPQPNSAGLEMKVRCGRMPQPARHRRAPPEIACGRKLHSPA